MSEGDTIPMRGSADMWRSRAKAAEDEVERLKAIIANNLNDWDATEVFSNARIVELEAKVARLTQLLDDLGHRYAGVESSLHGASARIAELEAEVAILKDVRATEQYPASLPVGDKELDFAKRTATEAALRFVQKRWPRFYLNESDIQACIEALLGNNETNTNNQGERNA